MKEICKSSKVTILTGAIATTDTKFSDKEKYKNSLEFLPK